MCDGCCMSVGEEREVSRDDLERMLRAELFGPTVPLASNGVLWRVDMAKFGLWRGRCRRQ
jgi:hypothetical protein